MATARDPVRTREALLEAAFRGISHHGFQATSLGSILARAGVTKGALYHHFRSKRELGNAVLEERIRAGIRRRWNEPLTGVGDPLAGLSP